MLVELPPLCKLSYLASAVKLSVSIGSICHRMSHFHIVYAAIVLHAYSMRGQREVDWIITCSALSKNYLPKHHSFVTAENEGYWWSCLPCQLPLGALHVTVLSVCKLA